jgi:hypothetical protein
MAADGWRSSDGERGVSSSPVALPVGAKAGSAPRRARGLWDVTLVRMPGCQALGGEPYRWRAGARPIGRGRSVWRRAIRAGTVARCRLPVPEVGISRRPSAHSVRRSGPGGGRRCCGGCDAPAPTARGCRLISCAARPAAVRAAWCGRSRWRRSSARLSPAARRSSTVTSGRAPQRAPVGCVSGRPSSAAPDCLPSPLSRSATDTRSATAITASRLPERAGRTALPRLSPERA